MRSIRLAVVVLGLVLLTASLLGPAACTSTPARAEARRIANRHDLIGGPRALGEVGDWLLQNDQIRVIIQDQGFSRGFGVFGGSLIDADLVRPPGAVGDSAGGVGHDNFGEMFPAFFLEALEPSEVNDPNNAAGETNRLPAMEIENDGANGEPAVLVVRGYGADFLALTQQINEALLDDSRELPRILFETRYILRPGAKYVEIETKVQNIIFNGGSLTWEGGLALVGQPVPTPFGDVVLFGAGNKVFLPHEAGYDLRYSLEDVYAEGRYSLPALPGLVADFVASTGDDVSYGLIGDPNQLPERNFAMSSGQFEEAQPHSIHIPFIASAFTGVFHVVPPVLAPNDRQPGGDDEFTFRRYFIVGNGDVASISDVAYDLIGVQTGTLSGELLEDGGEAHPVEGAHVIVHKLGGQKVTECTTDADGRWRADLPAGTYNLIVRKTGRALTAPVETTVQSGQSTFQRLTIAQPARLAVTITEPGVGRVPAKVTLVGLVGEEHIGEDTKDYLFDLSVGEPWRFTDLVPDTAEASTRRYIEAFEHAPHGQVTMTARPGTYTAFITRGPEYDRVEQEVVLEAGGIVSISAELHRVVPTPGYVAADFHLHSRFSLDSDEPLDERLTSYVGEGLEYVVSTDHNFVVDYTPIIAHLGFERFVNSAVGLELTTIDRGHFNGFPLRLGPGAVGGVNEEGGRSGTIASRTFGSFQWARKTPQEVFDNLRALGMRETTDPACALTEALTWPIDVVTEGRPLRDNLLEPAACRGAVKKVIVQVNHPRDSILGYFEQYGVSQDTLETQAISGLFAPNTQLNPEFNVRNMSWDFDAIEAFNGKRYDFLRNYTVPEGVTVDPVSCCPVVPGQVLREFRRPLDCDPEMRDCTCTPADTQQQVDDGNCEERAIAFPGAIDDWMSVLRTGRRVVGTANSDSHEHSKEEPGYPRTYVAVPSDVPSEVTPDDIVAAFQAGDLLMTNGPFVSVEVDGNGMGSVVDLSGGEASLNVTVRSAPWVVPGHVRVYRNAELVLDEALSTAVVQGGKGEYLEGTLSMPLTAAGGDGFVVVEVTGEQDFFPSIFPNEIPPLQFNDVLTAIGGSFGLGGATNALSPQLTHQVTPYAMTNPIWLDADGDGEITPLVDLPDPAALTVAAPNTVQVGPPRPTQQYIDSGQQHFDALPVRQQEALKRMPRWLWPSRHPSDVRRVLWQFVPHAH